jgi:excisionase family DNA binding protein
MQDDFALDIEIEEQALRWSRSEALRRFIAAVAAHQRAFPMNSETRRRAREWLARARQHADRLDPLQNGYIDRTFATIPSRVSKKEEVAPPAVPPAPSSASNNAPPPQRMALSISQAVVQSGLSRSFLYRAMDEGGLPFIKKGRRRLILAAALAEYLTRSTPNRLVIS